MVVQRKRCGKTREKLMEALHTQQMMYGGTFALTLRDQYNGRSRGKGMVKMTTPDLKMCYIP